MSFVLGQHTDELTKDQSLGRPWTYKGRLYLGGSNSTAIENIDVACRIFFIN